MNRPTDSLARSWKSEPWVWLLIAIPASAVVMGVLMLTLAIGSFSGLVVDDYYRKGKQINRVIARDRQAWELGLAARLELRRDDSSRLILAPGFAALGNGKMRLDLVHATIPGRDLQLEIDGGSGTVIPLSLAPVGEGRWNVYLHSAHWRLTGSLQRPGQHSAELGPNYRPPVR